MLPDNGNHKGALKELLDRQPIGELEHTSVQLGGLPPGPDGMQKWHCRWAEMPGPPGRGGLPERAFEATASTKKEAEQQCARQALQLLETTTHGLPTAGGGPAAGPPCFIDAMSQFSAGSYTWTTSLPSVAGVPVGADAPPTPVCPDDLASPHELRAALQAALAREARLISLLRHTHDQLDAAINDALAGGPDSSPHGGGTAASKDRRQ